jgi:GNAT superfamily N-acetyltransferase
LTAGIAVSERIEGMHQPTSAKSVGVVIRPEPYTGAGPRRVVEEAETELVARYGGLADDEFGLTAAMFEPPAGTFLVARSAEGLVVGGVGVRPFEQEAGVGEVKRLWVDPAWRRRGLARMLMDDLESAARRLDFCSLHLATGDRQPEAEALYRGASWERRRYDHAGALLPDWHLQFSKPLPRTEGQPNRGLGA